MDAIGVVLEEFDLDAATRVELVIWQVPVPVRGSAHSYKYRLALIVKGNCVLRYDNEAGKGDHRHVGTREFPYAFSDVATLMVDFWTEVDAWLTRRGA